MYWFASAKCVANLRASESERSERVGAERLEFVDVHEERHALVRRQSAALHGDELKVRDKKRAEQVRCLLPYRPLGKVRDQDAPIVHRELEIETRRDLAEDEPQLRRGVELPDLIQDRRDRLGAKSFRVARKLLVPEAQRFGIAHAAKYALPKMVVDVEARQDRSGSRARGR